MSETKTPKIVEEIKDRDIWKLLLNQKSDLSIQYTEQSGVVTTSTLLIYYTEKRLQKTVYTDLKVREISSGDLKHYRKYMWRKDGKKGNEKITHLSVSPDHKWAFLLINSHQVNVLSLTNFELTTLVDLSKRNDRFSSLWILPTAFVASPRHGGSLVVQKFANCLNFEFFAHVQSLVQHDKEKEDLSHAKFKQRLAGLVMFPEMINLNHIYAYFNAYNALGAALDSGCPLLVNPEGVSPLKVGLDRSNLRCVAEILRHMVAQIDEENFDSLSQLDGNLISLHESQFFHLPKIYHSLMLHVTSNVPKQLNLRKTQDYKWLKSEIPQPSLFEGQKVINVDVEYLVSSLPLSFTLACSHTTKFVNSLTHTPNQQILTSEIVDVYTKILWKKALRWIIIQAIFHMLWTILLSVYIIGGKNEDLLFSIFVFNLVFIVYNFTIPCIRGNLTDLWTIIDQARSLFALSYTLGAYWKIGWWTDDQSKMMLAYAALFTGLRIIGFFRLIDQTRYLIKMIICIMKAILPFTSVFLVAIYSLSLSFHALEESNSYNEDLIMTYLLGYGEFGDYGTFQSQLFMLIASILLPLIMLNILIAIVTDEYDKIQQERTIMDTKERLIWVSEISRLVRLGYYLCRRRDKTLEESSKFIHICKAEFVNARKQKGRWSGKINALHEVMKKDNQEFYRQISSDVQDQGSHIAQMEAQLHLVQNSIETLGTQMSLLREELKERRQFLH